MNMMVFEYNFRAIRPVTNIDVNIDTSYFNYSNYEPLGRTKVQRDIILHVKGPQNILVSGQEIYDIFQTNNIPLVVLPSKYVNLMNTNLNEFIWITTGSSSSVCPWAHYLLDSDEDIREEFKDVVDSINMAHRLPTEIIPMSSVSRVLHQRIASDSLAQTNSAGQKTLLSRQQSMNNNIHNYNMGRIRDSRDSIDMNSNEFRSPETTNFEGNRGNDNDYLSLSCLNSSSSDKCDIASDKSSVNVINFNASRSFCTVTGDNM